MKPLSEHELRHKLTDQEWNGVLFWYTPLCGTCKITEKMLDIIRSMHPQLHVDKVNVNFMRNLTQELQIQSVPCVMLIEGGKVTERLYAIHSIDHLYTYLQTIMR